MTQPTSPFINGIISKAAAQLPVRQPQPVRQSLPALPVQTQVGASKRQYNPFMVALNQDSPEFKDVYGVNRPLGKPMFLGYKDDQPMYGGGRLFILY